MTQLQPSPRHRSSRRRRHRRRLPGLPHVVQVVLTFLIILAAGLVLGGLMNQPFNG